MGIEALEVPNSGGLSVAASPKLDFLSALVSAEKQRILDYCFRLVLISLRLFLHFTFLFLSPAFDILSAVLYPQVTSSATNAPPARALVQVLGLLSRVTASSRKHEFIRSLAETLLDDNTKFSSVVAVINRMALTEAFSQAMRVLEDAMEVEAPRDKGNVIAGALRYGLTRFGVEEGSEVKAEEVAGEMMWMAQKMSVCGAVDEAVVMWGRAERLGRLAATAESRVQIVLFRLSVLLFKHANKTTTDGKQVDNMVRGHANISMLRTWLPLLCRVSNSVVTTVMSSGAERGEVVRVLEEMIEKLSSEEQEDVLALWVQHFSLSPDSDWPNLEPCYRRWYARSRVLLLE